MARPLAFKHALLEARHNYENGYGYLATPADQSAPTSTSPFAAHFDVHRTLEELARLRDRGILSVDEFEAKKRELLNRT
jgi:hypothetical protein